MLRHIIISHSVSVAAAQDSCILLMNCCAVVGKRVFSVQLEPEFGGSWFGRKSKKEEGAGGYVSL